MINSNEELKQACAILKKRNTAAAQTVINATGWGVEKANSIIDELVYLGILGEVTVGDRRRVIKNELEAFISVEPVDEPGVPVDSAEYSKHTEASESSESSESSEVVITERVKLAAPLAAIKSTHIKAKKSDNRAKSLDDIVKDLETKAAASVFTGSALIGKIHEVVEEVRHQVDLANVGLAAIRKLKGGRNHLTVETYDPTDKSDGGIIIREGCGCNKAIVYIYWDREPTLQYFNSVKRRVENTLKSYLLRRR